jgi:demethylmenaquinone methyltransferase / 2-methoxy-6-polyprenyl-1,4-benzoquinol methylase
MPGAPADARASPRVAHARRLFAGIARGYDVMGEVLSFGQNRRWRRFLVSRMPTAPGSLVLDVATGTGAVAIDLARRPGVRVVGLDQSPEMLRRGRADVARAAPDGAVSLVLGRAEWLPFPSDVFDAVTFTYLLRYVDDPAATLAEIARVLRPGGALGSLEFGVPSNDVLRAGWFVHTRLALPVLGAAFSREWHRAGRFLGPSISDWDRRFPLPRQARLWRDAGIDDVRVRPMSFGAGVVMWGRKRG